jgi:hypothetical protein
LPAQVHIGHAAAAQAADDFVATDVGRDLGLAGGLTGVKNPLAVLGAVAAFVKVVGRAG